MRPVELATRFETPLYAYDLAAVRDAHAALRAVLPEPSELFYSLKANPHPSIVGELHGLGCRAEVSSSGELRAAVAAGVPPEHCLYTGPAKTDRELRGALDGGVVWFSVDSPRQLGALRVAAGGRPSHALLRLNVDRGLGGHGLTMTGTASQFGADSSWVEREPDAFAGVDGFHFYMGTNIPSAEGLYETFSAAVHETVRLADALGIEPAVVDLGGGFASPFAQAGARPEYGGLREALEALLDAQLPDWRAGRPRIVFESGRYLVGDSGTLLCRVQDVKDSKGKRFVLLDTGIHHLGGMSGLRRVPRIAPTLESSAPDGAPVASDVVGPLCTPLDAWARGMALPALEPGDVVTVPNVGAYGVTASLIGFLGHNLPLEVVLDGGVPVGSSRLTLTREETTT
jgi:diaminopimelate decarboxylase